MATGCPASCGCSAGREPGREPAARPCPLGATRRDLPKGGGKVTDVNGPGTNERKPVLAVQERLIALGAMTQAEADADRARMDAQTGRMAGDITNTTAAITKCEMPTLTEPAARKALKVDLVGGVGTGETNDAADVELVLNLLHGSRINADFDAASVVLEGVGRTVDPALLPGFLAGLTKLKKGYAGGYPWRGSTKRRKGLKVTDGTAAYQKAVDYNLAGRAAMNAWLDSGRARADQRQDPAQLRGVGPIRSGETVLPDQNSRFGGPGAGSRSTATVRRDLRAPGRRAQRGAGPLSAETEGRNHLRQHQRLHRGRFRRVRHPSREIGP